MDQDGKVDPKLFSTCRLCVGRTGSYQILPQTQTQIKQLFDITVDAFDGLPQLLCDDCHGVIGKLYTIRNNYQQKQLKLINQQKRYQRYVEETDGSISSNCNEEKQMDFSKMPAVALEDIAKTNVGQTFVMPTKAPESDIHDSVTPPPIIETTLILEPMPTEWDVTSSKPVCEDEEDESVDVEDYSPVVDEVVHEVVIEVVNDKISNDDDHHHHTSTPVHQYTSTPVVIASPRNEASNNKPRTARLSSTESNTSTVQNVIQNVDSSDSSSVRRSKSKKGTIKWKKMYKCKFCNESFPRLYQVGPHMSLHANLIKLQTELNLKQSYVPMERLGPVRVKSGPKAKVPDTSVTLRCNEKVQNVFDYYCTTWKLSNNGELSCDIIETEQKTRKLRLRRSYYVESDDSDSLCPPRKKKRSRINRISSSSSETNVNPGNVSKEPPQKDVEGSNAADKSSMYPNLLVPIKIELHSLGQNNVEVVTDESNLVINETLNKNKPPKTTSELPPKPTINKDLIREHKMIIMSKVKSIFDKYNYKPKVQRKHIIGKLLKNNETLIKHLTKYSIDIEWQHNTQNQKFEVIVTKNSQKVINGFEDYEPVEKIDVNFSDVSQALFDCRQSPVSNNNITNYENQQTTQGAPKQIFAAETVEFPAITQSISKDNLHAVRVEPTENPSQLKGIASNTAAIGTPIILSVAPKDNTVPAMVISSDNPSPMQILAPKESPTAAMTVSYTLPTIINHSLATHDYVHSIYDLKKDTSKCAAKPDSSNFAAKVTPKRHKDCTRSISDTNLVDHIILDFINSPPLNIEKTSENITQTQMVCDARSLQDTQTVIPYTSAPDSNNLVVYVSDEDENGVQVPLSLSDIADKITEPFQMDSVTDNMPIISYTESWAAIQQSENVNNTPGVLIQLNGQAPSNNVGQVPINQDMPIIEQFLGFESKDATQLSNSHIAPYIPVTVGTDYRDLLMNPQQGNKESTQNSPTTSKHARSLPKLLPHSKLMSALANSPGLEKQPKTYSRKVTLKEGSTFHLHTIPSTPNANSHNQGAPRLKCKPTSLLLSSNNGPTPAQVPVSAASGSSTPIDTYISRLQANGFSLVEDINSSNFTALARYNVFVAKSNQKLMVSLFVCQEDSKRFCIQVTDNRGRLALAKEPHSHQMQIFQSLQMQDVTNIIETNAKALSPSVLQNTMQFISTSKNLLNRSR